MLRLAPGSDVEIRLIPQNPGSLRRVVQIGLREFLQTIKRLLIDQISLFNPALDAANGSHTGKAFFAIDDLDTFTILHGPNAVVDSRHLVPERRLRRRYVSHFQYSMASAIASWETQESGQY